MSDLSKVAAPPRSISSNKLGFYGSWIAAAIALLALPYIFSSGGSLTTVSLIGISIIFSLSYNILLGQTGMLSFGHAVYYGLGGFATIHGMNLIASSRLPVPLPLVPLIGGISGLFFAVIFGWVPTRRSRTAFAMISLGIAELVASSSLILRSFFGGEAGISANRTKLLPVFGWNFGPADSDLLSGCILDVARCDRDVCPDAYAVWPNVQCPRARAVCGLRSACNSLSGFLLCRFFCRYSGRAGRDQFRDRQCRLSWRNAMRRRFNGDLHRRVGFSSARSLARFLWATFCSR
jgi:hypothetical protein